MPTTFVLKGEIALTNLPDQAWDFSYLRSAFEDFVIDKDSDDVEIAGGKLVINIDTSEASYRGCDEVKEALRAFCVKHAAEAAVFELEDDRFWVFGATPRDRWNAEFQHRANLTLAAQDGFLRWMETHPMPEA